MMDGKTAQELVQNMRRLEEKISSLELNMEKASLNHQLAESITGVVGLKEAMIGEHRVVKYVWAILLLVGISSTIFFIYKTTEEYLEEPTATKIKLNVSARYEIPTIALCPAAWLDTDKAFELGISEDALKYSLGYIDKWLDMHFDNITNAKIQFINFYDSKNFSTLLDYYKMIAINLSTVNTSKAYNNLSMAVKLGDSQSYLIGKIFSSFQICHSYAFSPADRSLYTTTSASIKFRDKTKGVVKILPGLWLQALTDINFQSNQIPSIYLPSFTSNKIIIGVHRFKMLNKKDTPCRERDEIPDSYLSSSCTADCQNQKYKELIDCQLFRYAFVPRIGSPKEYCNLMERTKINNWLFSEFRESDEHIDLTQFCLGQCAPRCNREIYQWSLQWQQILPSEGLEKNSTEKLTSVSVSIDHMAAFDGETMSMIEVSTYSYIELINNVGGTLGLFVGATLMTFAQVVSFCVEHFCGNKKQNDVVEKIRQGTF